MVHRPPQLGGGLRAVHHPSALDARAEAQVHQDDVDATGLRGGHGRLRGGDFAYHFDVLGLFEDRPQAKTDDFVIVGQKDPNHSRSPILHLDVSEG